LPTLLPGSVRASEVFDAYWRFAAERQEIFFRRLSGAQWPWTSDPILREYRFTNTFRASDRVSQHLITNVIYDGPQTPREVFFRILVFKMFNKIETWELLSQSLGPVVFSEYSFERYDAALTAALAAGKRIYNAAYIMPSGGPRNPEKKHRCHLKLIERMVRENVPEQLQDCRSMEKGFSLLRSYPMIGDFLAYQFITDVNYSTVTNFSEMEFVMPGPGARDGIRKCFHDIGRYSEADVIRMMTDIQEEQFTRLGLQFRSLWGRPLQLIDAQSVFCEVGKLARCRYPEVVGISGRTRIKQRFRPNPEPLTYWYPPKWGINHLLPTVAQGVTHDSTAAHL
jgi:hypothetical protein